MPRHGEDGDLFAQRVGANAIEVNRYSRPDKAALVLTDQEARWLQCAGLPSLLTMPSPVEQLAARRAAAADAPPPDGGSGDGAQASLLDPETGAGATLAPRTRRKERT